MDNHQYQNLPNKSLDIPNLLIQAHQDKGIFESNF